MNWSFTRVVVAAMMLSVSSAYAATASEEAQALINKGEFDSALKRLDGQLRAQPQDAEARFLRGLVLVKLNRTVEAIKVFADLTRDYPQLPEPYNNLAVLYAQQADYGKARDALEAALATHPSYATAHENLGDIYAALASASYNRALVLDQNNQAVRSKLALITQFQQQPGSKGSTTVASRPAPVAPAPIPAPAPVAVTPPPAAAPAAATTSESPVPSTVPELDSATAEAVATTLNAWARSWSSKDFDTYFSLYAPNFEPEGGISRAVWEAQRRDRITRPKRIVVGTTNPEISRLGPERARVVFTQEYQSDSFDDKVTKVLELQHVGTNWLIIREYTR